MISSSFDFKPLPFARTTHAELEPPLFDGDHTRGEDFAAGQLVSLQHAKKALLLAVRFTGGPDAGAAGWLPEHDGEVEFLLMEKEGRYFCGINRQSPERFCYLAGAREDVIPLDSLRRGADSDGRY